MIVTDTRFAFQLYSLRDIDDPLETVIGRVGDAGIRGVEFAGVDANGVAGADPDEVRTALDASDVSSAGAHVDLAAIEADPDGVASVCHTLGCDHVVVPWLDPEHFETAESIRTAADRLSTAARTLAEHGIALHYHNHDQEFVDVAGETALDRLLSAAEGIGLELDLGWAGAAGADPVALLARYSDRVDLLHLKDYDADAGETVPVGAGDLDVAAVADAARDYDVDWVIYEAEGGADTYETLDAAAEVGRTNFVG